MGLFTKDLRSAAPEQAVPAEQVRPRRDTAPGVAGARAQNQGTASVGKTGLLVFKFP